MKDLLFEVPMDAPIIDMRHICRKSTPAQRLASALSWAASAKLHFRRLKTRSRGSASGCLSCSTERGVSCRVEDRPRLDTEDHGRAPPLARSPSRASLVGGAYPRQPEVDSLSWPPSQGSCRGSGFRRV